jgi:hypothetical protein
MLCKASSIMRVFRVYNINNTNYEEWCEDLYDMPEDELLKTMESIRVKYEWDKKDKIFALSDPFVVMYENLVVTKYEDR